jgi:hypothetical protein
VPKPVNGKWSLEYTVQIQSQEIFAKANPGWSTHVVDSRGRIYTYNAKIDRWVQEMFKK